MKSRYESKAKLTAKTSLLFILPGLFLLLLLLFLVISALGLYVPAGHSSRGDLYVEDRLVGKNLAVIYWLGDDARSNLPLTTVLEALGYPVEWDEDGAAHIVVGNAAYTLSGNDLSADSGKVVFKGKGYSASDSGIEGTPPGELYLERKDLIAALSRMGCPDVEVEINVKKRTVSVSTEAV